jgi:truncated hemoglobin YjbI
MFDEAFRGKKFTGRERDEWMGKITETLKETHSRLRQIVRDETAIEIASRAYLDAWNQLGFDNPTRSITI